MEFTKEEAKEVHPQIPAQAEAKFQCEADRRETSKLANYLGGDVIDSDQLLRMVEGC